MLSRSSWRAARVLKAARTGFGSGEPPPAVPSWSNKKQLVAECTCSARNFSQSSAGLSSKRDPISTLKVIDVKGKGRQEEQHLTVPNPTTTTDHPAATEQNEGTSYRSSSTSSRIHAQPTYKPSTNNNELSLKSFAEVEADLFRSLEDQTIGSIDTSWATFRRLPERRRSQLPVDILSKLSTVQKAGSLYYRGQLWNKLHWLYKAWELSDGNGDVQSFQEGSVHNDIDKRNVPREELSNTVSMLREWFEQKEVVHKSMHFSQARTLCVAIGDMLDPQQDIQVIDALAEVLYDYGSTENVAAFASSIVDKLSRSVFTPIITQENARLDRMSQVYSRMISDLAQRRHEALSIQLAAELEYCNIPINVEDCRSEILVAMLAHQLELPRTLNKEREAALALEREATRFGKESHFTDWWLQYNRQHAKVEQALANGRKVQESYLVALIGGDETKTALSLLKNRMRYLLIARPTVQCFGKKFEQAERKIETLILVRSLEALRLYEEYLANGFEADRETYRLAKMAKARSDTYSNFSKDLREAAHLRALEQRKRDALNFKKKWYPAAEITGRWQESKGSEDMHLFPRQGGEHVKGRMEGTMQRLEEQYNEEEENAYRPQRPNIYENASLGEILHLAIEIGDLDLARATFQAVRDDSTFSWTLNDSSRVLSLLEILIADAKRPDLDRTAKQDAVQIACAFYVRWQEDLNRDARSHRKVRSSIPARLRSPAFDLISLIAENQQAYLYGLGLQALLRDPSVPFATEHINFLAKELLRRGSKHRVALRLYLAQNILQSSDATVRFCEELDRAITNARIEYSKFSDRAHIRWCITVLQFMDDLDVPLSLEALNRVMHVYDGTEKAKEDSMEVEVVEEMRKIGLKPASLKESLLVDLRLSASESTDLHFLKLVEEDRIVEAAPSLPSIVESLLRRGSRQAARSAVRLFVMVAGDHTDSGHLQVINAIETAQDMLPQASKPAPEPARKAARLAGLKASRKRRREAARKAARKTEQTISIADETVAEVASQAPVTEAFVEVPQQDRSQNREAGFLNDFFADIEAPEVKEKQQHEWKPTQSEYSPSTSRWQTPERSTSNWQEATVGFQNAVGPEDVQAAAASDTDPVEVCKHDQQDRSYMTISSNKSAPQQQPAVIASPISVPNQAYSTLASQPNFFSSQPPMAQPTLLHELSQLPQQFADLTMDQILALKRRYEIEMRAIRRKDEQLLAARRMALSRADATRWNGWQEFQATPWY